LPLAIRTDNGTPFASNSAFFGLSKLSVWWLRLAIAIERIKPGNPQQNGRHERMHLTLKKEAITPPAKNFLQQQPKFDRFVECYNQERQHRSRPTARAWFHGLVRSPVRTRIAWPCLCAQVLMCS
jgi:putative transposase